MYASFFYFFMKNGAVLVQKIKVSGIILL